MEEMDYTIESEESGYSGDDISSFIPPVALPNIGEVVDITGGGNYIVVTFGQTIQAGEHQDLSEVTNAVMAGNEFSIVGDELRYLGHTIATGVKGLSLSDVIEVH